MIDRIVIAGGGTGGHLFPGIAVLEELRRRHPTVDALFVGTARGIEARVLPARGEKLELVDVRPLKGRGAGDLLRNLAILPGAAAKAGSILRKHKPDVVLGVGGYASGPMLAAAAAMRIPTAILEQNAYVGLTNRMLAPLVGRAYISFAETASTFGERKARLTGNPVRRAFVDAARRAMSDPDGFEARCRRVLILGGSQGARALNEAVPRAIALLGEAFGDLEIVHQTGESMREEVAERYRAFGVRADVVSFIDDTARAYASSAVVVARAGATTLAELCAIGRPSILVPYPLAADDHQRKNAEALERAGAARCVVQADLTPARLADELRNLLGHAGERRAMADAARRQGRPDAAAAIVDDLCEWLGCPPLSRESQEDESEHDAGDSEATPPATRAHLRGRSPYHPFLEGARVARREAMRSRPRRPLVLSPSLVE